MARRAVGHGEEEERAGRAVLEVVEHEEGRAEPLGQDARDPQVAAPRLHVARGPEVAGGQGQGEDAVELRVDQGDRRRRPHERAASWGATSSIGSAEREVVDAGHEGQRAQRPRSLTVLHADPILIFSPRTEEARMSTTKALHGTTILAVRHGGGCAIAGDGQVTPRAAP